MTKFDARLILGLLEECGPTQVYVHQKELGGWKDHHFQTALAAIRRIAEEPPDPTNATERVADYVLNFLACCTQEMHEAEVIKRDEHGTADRIVNELADAVREIRDRQPPYDPEFGDERECVCGHTYYRHFDSYEDMYPRGCKYCQCRRFREKTDDQEHSEEGP